MLLPFQPNIREQTLASAGCVCQSITTMNTLKGTWSLLFSNTRHFEEEPVLRINSNTLHLASHDSTACCAKATLLDCQTV